MEGLKELKGIKFVSVETKTREENLFRQAGFLKQEYKEVTVRVDQADGFPINTIASEVKCEAFADFLSNIEADHLEGKVFYAKTR